MERAQTHITKIDNSVIHKKNRKAKVIDNKSHKQINQTK